MPETDTTDQASLCELPAIGQPLMGGTFAGITTQADGTHCAVILLADRIDRAKVPVLCTYPNCDCHEPLDKCGKTK